MGMRPQNERERRVPEETGKIAAKALGKKHPYVVLRDELEAIYNDEQFRDLYGYQGQDAVPPWRLAVVTVLQFAEGLTDEQAVESVRARIDWKYLLGLELENDGFDASVLSEFRQRLVKHEASERLLSILLEALRKRGMLKGRRQQRTDSTHVLDAVRSLNRLELIGEAMRQALNDLARVIPEWVRQHAPQEWYERYGDRFEAYHLPHKPGAQKQLAEQIGADGVMLLNWLYSDPTMACLSSAPAVETLRRIWLQNFTQQDGKVIWREAGNLPLSAQMIVSPFDVESRFSRKRDMTWEGYKVHLTETCESESPHLIVHVATTVATTTDAQMMPVIQADLAKHDLSPQEHFVDAGYINSDVLIASQARGIEVVGPLSPDSNWRSQHSPDFVAARFGIDWEARQATCPQGHRSQKWAQSSETRVAKVTFNKTDCLACPCRDQCVRSATGARTLELLPRAKHELIQRGRAYCQTLEFAQRYKRRAGIEATLSQALRSCDMRASRYIGIAKTHLQQVAVSVAINLRRVFQWIVTDGHPSRSYRAPFLALAAT